MRWLCVGEFERQAAGMRLVADPDRRRRAAVHEQHRAAAFKALIAGMRGVVDRAAARIVVGEHGREHSPPASAPCR